MVMVLDIRTTRGSRFAHRSYLCNVVSCIILYSHQSILLDFSGSTNPIDARAPLELVEGATNFPVPLIDAVFSSYTRPGIYFPPTLTQEVVKNVRTLKKTGSFIMKFATLIGRVMMRGLEP